MKNCYNSETNKILKVAEKEMLSCHHPYVGTEHLLLALLSTNNRLKDILLQNNLSYSKCKNLSIIQLFQILNYKRHWEYYLRYHSRGSISYEDFLVIFKHLKLNTDHVNQIIHSNLIITLSEAKSESTFESEFLYTFNTTCTS